MNGLELYWDESAIVPISALEHYVYCPRQCALIHIEQTYDENEYTVRGRSLHEQVDIPRTVSEEGLVSHYALPLWSVRLGLIGRADLVLIYPDGTPYPIEYKSGTKKVKYHDEVQLCAQAMCLEEMLNTSVPEGSIYYHSSRRRRTVQFTPELRQLTEQTIVEVRALLQQKRIPPPANDARCPGCSLIQVCMPDLIALLQNPAYSYDPFRLSEPEDRP